QRWLNHDPLEEWADVNLYRFNYNAPTVYVDPNGENPAAIGIGIGIGVGGGGPGIGAGLGIGGAVGLGPGLAIGGAAGIGWGIGSWINDNTPVGNIGTAIGNWICPPVNESRAHGQGERGRTGPGGQNNPWKHTRPHRTDPGKIQEKGPDGKWKDKPKPPGWDEWHNGRSEEHTSE